MHGTAKNPSESNPLSLKKRAEVFVPSLTTEKFNPLLGSHGRRQNLRVNVKKEQKKTITNGCSRIVNNIVNLLKPSQNCDVIYTISVEGGRKMAVSYKRLLHLMIEKDVSSAELMRKANISANIISKIKNGQYMALDKVESICVAMDCTPNDILEFLPEEKEND